MWSSSNTTVNIVLFHGIHGKHVGIIPLSVQNVLLLLLYDQPILSDQARLFDVMVLVGVFWFIQSTQTKL